MKNILLIIAIFFATSIYGQTAYNSSVTTKYNCEGEVIKESRTITISDSEISITNFLGGTRPLNLVVNDIKEKEDDWKGLMRWYYCINLEKDIISGKSTEYIIIMKASYPSDMSLYQKVDDVTYIRTDLSLK